MVRQPRPPPGRFEQLLNLALGLYAVLLAVVIFSAAWSAGEATAPSELARSIRSLDARILELGNRLSGNKCRP